MIYHLDFFIIEQYLSRNNSLVTKIKKLTIMKTLLIAILLTFGLNSNAQTWVENLEEAKTLASKESKHIIVVFQGSDWCAPCRKLEKNVWQKEDFKSLAKDKFIMLKVDFPRKKKNALSKSQKEANKLLAEKYNPNGYFPLVLVLDHEEKLMGETGYKKLSANEYFDHLNSFIK